MGEAGWWKACSDLDRKNAVDPDARRSIHHHLVAFMAPHQAAAYGGFHGQFPRRDIRFVGAYEFISAGDPRVDVLNDDHRPEADLLEIILPAHHDFAPGQLFLDVLDLFLKYNVSLTGIQVLLVVRFHSVRPGLLQVLEYLRTHDTPKVKEFSQEPSVTVPGDGHSHDEQPLFEEIFRDLPALHPGTEKGDPYHGLPVLNYTAQDKILHVFPFDLRHVRDLVFIVLF